MGKSTAAAAAACTTALVCARSAPAVRHRRLQRVVHVAVHPPAGPAVLRHHERQPPILQDVPIPLRGMVSGSFRQRRPFQIDQRSANLCQIGTAAGLGSADAEMQVSGRVPTAAHPAGARHAEDV